MNKPYDGQEKRHQRRIDVNFIVMYKVNFPVTIKIMVGDKEVCAIALDLSEGGLAVLTNYEIPLLTQVTIKFIVLNESALNIRERTRSLEVNGDIRYCIMTEEKVYRIGIRFVDLTEADRRFIADFVRTKAI